MHIAPLQDTGHCPEEARKRHPWHNAPGQALPPPGREPPVTTADQGLLWQEAWPQPSSVQLVTDTSLQGRMTGGMTRPGNPPRLLLETEGRGGGGGRA